MCKLFLSALTALCFAWSSSAAPYRYPMTTTNDFTTGLLPAAISPHEFGLTGLTVDSSTNLLIGGYVTLSGYTNRITDSGTALQYNRVDVGPLIGNVKLHGAVGDGVTDDTTAIQAAITAATNGVVYFPAGVYLTTSSVIATGRRVFTGDSAELSIIRRTGVSSNAVLVLSPTSGFIGSWGVQRLSIDGGGVAPGISTTNMNDGIIEQCQIYNYVDYGVRWYGGVHNMLLKCRVRGAGDVNSSGLSIAGGSGHTVIGNSFATDAIGIDFESPSNGLTIGPGNTFEPNITGINVPTDLSGSINALTIQGNFFESNSGTPIAVGHTARVNDVQGITVTGNEFATAGNGQLIFDNAAYMSVFGNRFGPAVSYGTNVSRLKLQGNRYSSTKTNYTTLGFDNDENAVSSIGTNGVYIVGKLGVGSSSPSGFAEIAGATRISSNSNLPTTGEGLELLYQTSPTLGIVASLSRDTGIWKPLELRGVNVGINTVGVPSTAATLELGGVTGGLLLNRVTAAERVAIASPTNGLVVYQTDGTAGVYLYSGGWVSLVPTTINSTDNYIPYRTSSTAFGDSPLKVLSSTAIRLNTDTNILTTSGSSLIYSNAAPKITALNASGAAHMYVASDGLRAYFQGGTLQTYLLNSSGAGAVVVDSSGFYPFGDLTLDLGATGVQWKDLYLGGRHVWNGSTNSVFDSAGNGSPEGVLAASVGSTYRRYDGGASTTFYVKESGTGNTGWVAK